MPRPPTPIHYLRPNESERTPCDVLIFDTESRWTDTDTGEHHTLRLWVAAHDRRRDDRVNPDGTLWGTGETGDALADWIVDRARTAATLWVFAHNLAFDLALAPLPDLLTRRGWTVTECSVRSASPWFRLAKGNYRIALVDSWSWVPTPLTGLQVATGVDKPQLPDNADAWRVWFARCHADVEITRSAVHTVLDFWEGEQLGRWTISGPACGWNAWRHKYYADRMLIDPDPELRAFERKALYGGRREAYRIGCSPRGRFVEVDYVNAYPAIAGNVLLPVQRLGRFPGLADDDRVYSDEERGFVANVTVTTDTACVPCRIDNTVFYPTGQFHTVLTSVEVQHARDSGAQVDVGTGVDYVLAPLLQEWSRWVTSPGPDPDTLWPGPVLAMLKHWGRTVIGRFAARSSSLTPWDDAPSMSWGMEHGRDVDTGLDLSWLDIGGRRWLVTHDVEPENALPAVTAFVEAHCRVALAHGMQAHGCAEIVQCDTDGWLARVDRGAGRWKPDACRRPALASALPVDHSPDIGCPSEVDGISVRAKAAYRHVDLLGPSHIWTDGEARLSGVPRSAEPAGDGTYRATLWPKLAWQLAHGRGAGYLRPAVRIALTGPYGSRWVLDDRRTAAPRTAIDGRTTVLQPWGPADTERHAATPVGAQHPALERAGVLAGAADVV